MGVSYSKEVLLVGRYVTSIIFHAVKVIIGVSYSKEVLLMDSLLQGGPPSGNNAASIIFHVGIVIMGGGGVSYSKEVLQVGRYVDSIIFSGVVFIGVSYCKEFSWWAKMRRRSDSVWDVVILGVSFSKKVLLNPDEQVLARNKL